MLVVSRYSQVRFILFISTPMEKSFYALSEASTLLGRTIADLIPLAAKEDITLLIGVPDGIRFQIFDADTNRTESPALLEPQLLAITATQCQKIQLNGRTEQSDFRLGYLIAPNGALQPLKPSYGKAGRLEHGWAYWRTYKGPYITELELTPDRLFAMGEDVRRILVGQSQSITKEKSKKKDYKLAEVPPLQSSPADSNNSDQTAYDAAAQSKNKEATSLKSTSAESTPDTKSIEPEAPFIILRMPEVTARTGLSKSTIYDKLDPKSPRFDPTFPQRRKLGTSAVGWVQSEIEAWLIARQTGGNLSGV